MIIIVIAVVDYVTRLRGCDNVISVQAGRLEIYYKQKWSTICSDGFNDRDAHVACYNLGFESLPPVFLLTLNLRPRLCQTHS